MTAPRPHGPGLCQHRYLLYNCPFCLIQQLRYRLEAAGEINRALAAENGRLRRALEARDA